MENNNFLNVECADRNHLDKTVDKICADGADVLHILADFDRTLTTANVDGRPMPSLISVLRDEKYLTPEYAPAAHALYSHYSVIEKDHNIPLAEKKKLMEEWWRRHFELLIKCGLTKQDVEKAMREINIKFRTGAQTFLETMQKHRIPIVIMSASGLGSEAITQSLQRFGYHYDNIHVISNAFIWGADGKAIGVQEPIIHNLNKDETALGNYEAYKVIKGRPNVILIGDNIGDIGMLGDLPHENVLKIGFLNEDGDEERLKKYKDNFDAVITGDGSFDFVNYIVSQCLS